jgi:hypothetical protein
VVVGDDDLRLAHVAEHVVRHQLAVGVVAIRVVGLEDAQPIFDRQAGRSHEKAAREVGAPRMTLGVNRLPRDEHRHHGGLAGAGGEL